VLAERGYSALSVAEICSRAGVSRLTFYKLYENKLDCALELQDETIVALEAQFDRAEAEAPEWRPRVAATIAALLGFASREPGRANLVLSTGPLFAEPELVRPARALQRRLTERLLHGAPSVAPPVDSARSEVLVAGMLSVLAEDLSRSKTADLPALAGELTELVIAHCTGYGAHFSEANPEGHPNKDGPG
jgi:AcrR family transcriptional regulator